MTDNSIAGIRKHWQIGNDKYVLGYYSTDGNPKDAELITVRKNGNPELCVRGIVFYNATINPESSNPQKFKYTLVRLEGAENKGYSLIDDNLANVLVQVLCDSQFKNATKNTYVMELDSEYMTRSEERRVGKECRSRWSLYH